MEASWPFESIFSSLPDEDFLDSFQVNMIPEDFNSNEINYADDSYQGLSDWTQDPSLSSSSSASPSELDYEIEFNPNYEHLPVRSFQDCYGAAPLSEKTSVDGQFVIKQENLLFHEPSKTQNTQYYCSGNLSVEMNPNRSNNQSTINGQQRENIPVFPKIKKEIYDPSFYYSNDPSPRSARSCEDAHTNLSPRECANKRNNIVSGSHPDSMGSHRWLAPPVLKYSPSLGSYPEQGCLTHQPTIPEDGVIFNSEQEGTKDRTCNRPNISLSPSLSSLGHSSPALDYSPIPERSYSEPPSPSMSTSSTPRSISPRMTASVPRANKRSSSSGSKSNDRERRVRPKVVAEKGALQCRGINRKKNTRCRNAALMEYIGPRPVYCAEHITLDPDSLYSKCASIYHNNPGDGKGCREVVLKEFKFCHKHFSQMIDQYLNGPNAYEGRAIAQIQYDRVCYLLTQLETEAAAAKKTDPDLFQRKHKLIPKFVEVKKLLSRRLTEFDFLDHNNIQIKEEFDNAILSSFDTSSPSSLSSEEMVSCDRPFEINNDISLMSYYVPPK